MDIKKWIEEHDCTDTESMLIEFLKDIDIDEINNWFDHHVNDKDLQHNEELLDTVCVLAKHMSEVQQRSVIETLDDDLLGELVDADAVINNNEHVRYIVNECIEQADEGLLVQEFLLKLPSAASRYAMLLSLTEHEKTLLRKFACEV